jgi:cytochrome c-type biogenesis protein CcmH
MTGFVIGAAIAVVLVLALLLRPFFRKSAGGGQSSQRQFNTAILRDQVAKLDQDVAEGTLSDADRAQARAELQRRALQDTLEEDAVATLRAPKKTMAAVGVLLPVAAVALYLLIGNPASMTAGGAHQQMANAQDLDRMVAALAEKLEKEPNNPKGWAMLARSYKVMGRTAEAEKAFERAGSFIDDDAQMLAAYADVVASNNGGTLVGKPAMLIQKALKADPDNAMAMWLSGTADLEAKNYKGALRTWERLAALLPPGSDDARMLQGAIDDVRAKAGLPAKAPAVALGAAAGGNISGTVELDPSLKGKAAPDDTVMVIARLPGSRMPLAAVRLRAAELPVKFTLDDSLSMNPQSPISAAAEVEVEARISKTGLAKAEPGDLISAVQTVKVGARGVALRVAKVRP